MIGVEDELAFKAVLAMLLEVSANPKPGNVDRDHDFSDLKYEHFLVSASASFPVFREIAERKLSIGKGVYELVKRTREHHNSGNVHFGAFLLLSPLLHAHGSPENAFEEIKCSDVQDSIWVKRAFDISGARVMDVSNANLKDEVEREIVERDLNLYRWMKLAPDENFIAKEYTSGFKLSIDGKKMLMDFYDEFGDANKAIVLTYISFLSELVDPLIIAKKGFEKAELVKKQAKLAFEIFKETGNFSVFDELDSKLLRENVNPGSVADLVISSIFLALVEGWRF